MRYHQWNDAIASKFFNLEMSNRRVYLYVTSDVIRSIGNEFHADEKDFVKAIKEGPEFRPNIGVCAHAEKCYMNWRRGHPSYPPYIAYLAFFALAAGLDGDFVPHAYYPRLRQLLGEEPISGTYHGFAQMRVLWEDLETWSQRDRHGEVGIFQVNLSTRLIHVGIPISQTILSEGERLLLPRLFAAGGLDPASMPSDVLLAQIVRDNNDGTLRTRTRMVLNEPSLHAEEYEALTDALLQELAAWDGTVKQGSDGQRRAGVYGVIKLSCRSLDQVSGNAAFQFLCRTQHEFPEDDLVLQFTGAQESYQCREFRSGWSTPLEDQSGNELDASSFDWCSGLRLKEVNRGWKFSLGASPVRVLTDAKNEGLEGLVEIQNLPSAAPFLIAARQDFWGIVELWGTSACSGFQRLPILSGLAHNWRLYSVGRALDDSVVSSLLPALSFGRTTHIGVKGGIRVSGNRFFSFALPEIVVYGAPGETIVLCNGKPLEPTNNGSYSLEDCSVANDKLTIEAKADDRTICRYAIYVQSDFAWPQKAALAWSNHFGFQASEENSLRVAGSLIFNKEIPEFNSWITATPLVIPFIETVQEFAEATPVLDIETLETVVPTIDAMSHPEIKELLDSWKSELGSIVPTEYIAPLNDRHMGSELTEGTLQYIAAVSRQDTRSFNRAIKELRQAQNSADQIVSSLARVFLQLAYFRSGRHAKVTEMRGITLPRHFHRLEYFMRRLAGEEPGTLQLVGFGIEDVSPLADDAALADSIMSQTTPTGGPEA
jgi:hypothetical protein